MVSLLSAVLPLVAQQIVRSDSTAASASGGFAAGTLRPSPRPLPSSPITVHRLPDLNVPRHGHYTFCTDDEIIVIGGHTSGFVPTATAEYYRDGAWHLLPTVYIHDQGLAFQLKSGSLLIAGGHEQPLGIGLTFPMELYDPATHTFKGYGCLDRKRCFAQAAELDSGRVIITGNWYADDAIECYDGSRQCLSLKTVSQNRSIPFVLRTAKDNAIIFSGYDSHAHPLDSIIVDRLNGDPFAVPLLQTWRPFYNHVGPRCADCFIGDEDNGEFAHLITAINKDGQLAIIKVEGEQFSLLPTDCPVPMKSQWGPISYTSYVVADRKAGKAYVTGFGEDESDRRLYVLCIDYKASPAALTLNYTEPQDSICLFCNPVLTPDGNLVMVGGVHTPFNNYEPHARALLLCVGSQPQALTPQHLTSTTFYLTIAVLILVAATIAILLWWRRRKGSKEAKDANSIEAAKSTDFTEIAKGADSTYVAVSDDNGLMARICALMEEQQLFLNSELKMTDVADALHTNRTYVSNSIKAARGCTFNQFVNEYRVEYAKQLLRKNPDTKISEVWTASGFSTEVSFFRTFKTLCGMTPKEWIAKLHSTE